MTDRLQLTVEDSCGGSDVHRPTLTQKYSSYTSTARSNVMSLDCPRDCTGIRNHTRVLTAKILFDIGQLTMVSGGLREDRSLDTASVSLSERLGK